MKIKNNIIITNQQLSNFLRILFMAAIMCAYFKPAHYIVGSSINKIWKAYTLLVSIAGIVYFILKKKGKFQKKDSSLLLIVLGYIICYLASSLLNFKNCNFFDAVQDTVETIGYVSIASAGILYHTKTYFKGYLLTGLFWTILHLFTILIYQDGGMRSGRNLSMGKSYSENWYLLTHANASYFIIMAVMAVLFFYAYVYNKKLRTFAWLYLLFSIYCFFTQWSVAGLIGFCIFAILMIFEIWLSRISFDIIRPKKKKSKLKLYLILCLLLDILLTFGGLLEKMLGFFKQYFNKSHSLEARITIWKKSIALLRSKHFIIGFGWENEDVTILKTTYNHMHNVLLEILYRGGIIALILFVAGLLIAYFHKHPKKYNSTVGYRILTYITIAFFISANFDFYLYRYEILVVPIIFLYYETIQQHHNKEISKIRR